MGDEQGRAPRSVEVLGDGPAAWAVAIALARVGWSITVRRRLSPARQTPRIELIAASAARHFSWLGITQEDLQTVARPCPGTWSCWGREGASCVDAITSPHGASWSVDRAKFDALLRQRAFELGVNVDTAATRAAGDVGTHSWQIIASGAVSNRTWAPVSGKYDDHLIAFVGYGPLSATSTMRDARLLIEALPEGWAYGLLGPVGVAGVGFLTDSECLDGKDAQAFASDALRRSQRIVRLLDAIGKPTRLAAVPVPCRWRPLLAGSRTLRVGDAQACYDPVAGRGLWEALRMVEQVTAAMDVGGEGLQLIEQASLADYHVYLQQRDAVYAEAYQRYGTPFWERRVTLDRSKVDLSTTAPGR